MLRTPVQTVINITVIILIIGALVFGALAMIPSRNPLGPIIGRVLTTKEILSGLLSTLDPVELAEALEANPEMTDDLLAELGEDGAVIIATAINDNPEFIAAFVANISPETVATLLNDPGAAEFTVSLMDHLEPEAVAGVVNENGEVITTLVGSMDPRVLAEAINKLSGKEEG